MAAPQHRRIPLFISTAYIPLSPSFSLFLSDAAPDGQHRNAEPSPPAKAITGNGIEGILKPISVLAILLNVLHRSPCDALVPSINYFFGLRLADRVWNAAWARLNCLFNCVLVMERTRPLPPPSLLPCKRRLSRYKSDPVVEPPPKRVRFDPDILLDEDIVMNDPTPVDPSTGVPQLEQKTPDNQGEPEAEVRQYSRSIVFASVLVPEQLTEVHHEPEQETEAVGTRDDHQELVRPNAPMVNSLTGALREAG
ncbi:hypothetical protein EDB83DRAFT_2527144 [Lactarius deliciosus]|nr:hypothetical protein EDB83DRAFT_2527144 [Lactarius deliciosus]